MSQPSRSSKNALAVARVFFRVRDLHDGGAGAVELAEKLHDFAGLRGVEVAGGLVGEQQRRRMNNGARNADQLLLAAGELEG